jgi:hypothetical protein
LIAVLINTCGKREREREKEMNLEDTSLAMRARNAKQTA